MYRLCLDESVAIWKKKINNQTYEARLGNISSNSPVGIQYIPSNEFFIGPSTSDTHSFIWCKVVPSFYFQ